jgi:hypothetical protein
MRLCTLLLMVAGFPSVAQANWTLNLGFHNPPGSSLGINFLYWATRWNFEAGLGWFDAKAQADDDSTAEEKKKKDEVSVALAGDLNIKYRFSSGSVAPYLQCGVSGGGGVSVGDKSDVGAGAGGPFAGVGIMFGSPRFYAYGVYNMWSKETGQAGAGLGFDI